MDVLLEARESHPENLVVVESQVRDIVPAEPSCIVGVGIGPDIRKLDQGVVGDCYDPLAGISLDVAECSDLLEALA